MVKILQINTIVDKGATGKIALDIGERINIKGWESYIIYGRKGKANSNSILIKIGNYYDFLLHALLTRLFDKHGFGSVRTTKKIIKEIIKIDPNLIHLHNIHGYYININLLFSFLQKIKKPVIWTFHDCWPLTGHCAQFENIGCIKWETGCNNCPKTKSYPKSISDNSKQNYLRKKQIFNRLDNLTIVCVCDWLKGIIRNSYLKNYNLEVIKNGVDLNIFKKKTEILHFQYIKNKNKFIILGVASNWKMDKGLSDFIKLSYVLNDDFQIVLVGLSATEIENLPKNILGMKRLNYVEQLVELYSIANVYLNLTSEDTFSTTNLEAMSCSLPVITYDNSGSREAVVENTGFAINKGDVNEIVQKIYEVRRLGKDYFSDFCRKRVEKLFNKDERFDDYIELYDRLLQFDNNIFSKK